MIIGSASFFPVFPNDLQIFSDFSHHCLATDWGLSCLQDLGKPL
jgi:hypothetical protein